MRSGVSVSDASGTARTASPIAVAASVGGATARISVRGARPITPKEREHRGREQQRVGERPRGSDAGGSAGTADPERGGHDGETDQRVAELDARAAKRVHGGAEQIGDRVKRHREREKADDRDRARPLCPEERGDERGGGRGEAEEDREGEQADGARGLEEARAHLGGIVRRACVGAKADLIQDRDQLGDGEGCEEERGRVEADLVLREAAARDDNIGLGVEETRRRRSA